MNQLETELKNDTLSSLGTILYLNIQNGKEVTKTASFKQEIVWKKFWWIEQQRLQKGVEIFHQMAPYLMVYGLEELR